MSFCVAKRGDLVAIRDGDLWRPAVATGVTAEGLVTTARWANGHRERVRSQRRVVRADQLKRKPKEIVADLGIQARELHDLRVYLRDELTDEAWAHVLATFLFLGEPDVQVGLAREGR